MHLKAIIATVASAASLVSSIRVPENLPDGMLSKYLSYMFIPVLICE
jgi:hypothetical protein